MALTREDALLIQLGEECAEVQQRASKALRFGLDEIQPGQPLTNRERLVAELRDLNTIVRMLQDDEALPGSAGGLEPSKVEKVNRFLDYSRELGRVAD